MLARAAQQMKHENAQKCSSKISPNSSPNADKLVAAIPLWGIAGVTINQNQRIFLAFAMERQINSPDLLSHLLS